MSKPKPNRQKDEGTVLITTLLIMAIMAAVIVSMFEDVRFAIKRTANVDAYAQSDWYARGAQDFAKDYLSERFNRLPPQAQNEILLRSEPITFPLERGVMTIRMSDGGHCFNLNSLIGSNGAANDEARLQFGALLELLAFPPNEAQAISAAITDWIDIDNSARSGGAEDGSYLRLDPPYRTANTALASPQEIRAIEGVTEDIYQTLRPFICTGEAGQETQFNINTARPEHAAVLAALMGGVDEAQTALALITDRPVGGGYSEESFGTSPYLSGRYENGETPQQVTFEPKSIWAEVEIAYGPVYRARSFAFDGVDKGQLSLTYRGWGRESFRPSLLPPETEEAESTE